jgi:hypothetical protein
MSKGMTEGQLKKLRAEVEIITKERDEARKLAEFWHDAVCDPRDPLGWLPWER